MRPADEVIGWFRGRIPAEWFTDPVDVDADREEIVLTGRVSEPPMGDAESAEAKGAACMARVRGFREDTREHRMRIASEAEAKFGKKVSWATRCGDVEAMFTNASVPVMTRLRMPERVGARHADRCRRCPQPQRSVGVVRAARRPSPVRVDRPAARRDAARRAGAVGGTGALSGSERRARLVARRPSPRSRRSRRC